MYKSFPREHNKYSKKEQSIKQQTKTPLMSIIKIGKNKSIQQNLCTQLKAIPKFNFQYKAKIEQLIMECKIMWTCSFLAHLKNIVRYAER